MFYEIIKELTLIRYNTSVWKKYGENFCRFMLEYGKGTGDFHKKQLFVIKEIANTLDVPVDFIISILKYERVEEFGNIQESASSN